MSEKSFVDFYEILQVNPRAEAETISRIYRHLAKRYHPDNVETGDRQRFDALSEAYETLMNPEKRAAYDLVYDGAFDDRLRLLDEAIAVHNRDEDAVLRERLLAVLYTQRRRSIHDPSMSEIEVERALGVPYEHLDFHLWYVKEKKWIERTDRGYAITALGIDEVESSRTHGRAAQAQLEAGINDES